MNDDTGTRQFVDTNILVYAHDVNAAEKHESAKSLITRLWYSGGGCLSIQVLQEFYVTVVQKLAKPLPSATAAEIITDLSQWRLHIPDVDDILEAITIHQQNNISFWDALIIRSAIKLECTVLWTEDLNPGQYCASVKILNPFTT
jgi:predicted nucleic acid-binding protein